MSTEPKPPLDSIAPGGRRRKWLAALGRLRKPVVIVAGIGTVLGGLAGYVTVFRTVTGSPGTAAAQPPIRTLPAAPLSVLVMPLANQTGDPARAYVSDGLTAAITGDLSRLSTAVVAPPQTALALAEKKLSLSELGQQGRARFVLSGAVAASGDAVRISLQLADAREGRQLWTQTFTGTLTNLFALQDEITMRVREAIEPRMVVIAANESEKKSQTPQVADLLLRAQAIQLQPGRTIDWSEVIALCRRVLAMEPDNLLAKRMLAATLVVRNVNQGSSAGLTPEQISTSYREAGLLARQVLSADANAKLMHSVLSWEAADQGDTAARRRYLEQGLALNPYDNSTLGNLGQLESELGNNELAYNYYARAADVPLYTPWVWYLARKSTMAFRLNWADKALEAAQRAVDADPQDSSGYGPLMLAYGLKGDTDRARQAAAELRRLDPSFDGITLPAPWPGKETEFAQYVERVLKPAAERAGVAVKPWADTAAAQKR